MCEEVKKEKSKTISIRLPEDELDDLMYFVSRSTLSRNSYVRQVLVEHVRKTKKEWIKYGEELCQLIM